MKKAITILGIMMLFMISFVSAASTTSGQIRLNIMPIEEAMANSTVNKTEFRATHQEVREQLQEHTALRNSTLAGLENARLRVTNEQAAQRIEANILKIQDRQRFMLNNLSNVNIAEGENNTIVIQGQDGSTKILSLFKVNRGVTFVVGENGEVSRLGRTFDFLYKYKSDVKEIKRV